MTDPYWINALEMHDAERVITKILAENDRS